MKTSLVSQCMRKSRELISPGLLLLVCLAVSSSVAQADERSYPILLSQDKSSQRYDWKRDSWEGDVQKAQPSGKGKPAKKQKPEKVYESSRSGSYQSQPRVQGKREQRQRNGNGKDARYYSESRPGYSRNNDSRAYSVERSRQERPAESGREYRGSSGSRDYRLNSSESRRSSATARDGNLDEAVSRIRRQTGGKVLSAETVKGSAGALEHHIRVYTEDGRVKRYRIKAE